ncbi:hypothetical protein ACFYUV_50060 [Nonomuraea sp. NPDC003560]|uniref:hypothetical protein n=1 Tax=Nonomuraea sp. NPDC003560 TaxID=3364341 RepID=UPI0036819471
MPLIAKFHLVDEESFWLGAGPVSTADLGLHGPEEPPIVCAADLGEGWTDRPWRLDLCRDGTLSIRRHGEQPFNEVARPLAYAWEKEPLQLAQVSFGQL